MVLGNFPVNPAENEEFIREIRRKLGLVIYFGTLGDSDDLTTSIVDEPGQPGIVRVRLENDDVPYRRVKSGLLGNYSPYAGSPVIVGYDEKDELEIKKADHDALREANVNPLVFNSGDSRVSGFKQTDGLLPLLTTAVGTANTPSLEIAINPFRYVDGSNTVNWFQGTQVDVTASVPSADQHCYLGIFLKTDNTLETVASTAKDTSIPLSESDKQEVFDGRNSDSAPVALWRLHDAQTNLTNSDRIEDLRQWLPAPGIDAQFSDAFQAPNGFEKAPDAAPPTDSTITYNPATRVISIAPTGDSFNYWLKGKRYTISSAQTPAAHADTTAVYFFYWDSNNTLTFSTTAWSIIEDVPIAAVYYNSSLTDGFALEERHGATRNINWHYSDHYKRGTFWDENGGLGISGYTLSPGAPIDSDNQWAIASGTIHDEDIAFPVTGRTAGTYEIFYRSGASGEWTWTQNNVPLLSGGGYLYYNEWTGATWQQTALANNKYVNYYIMSTSSLDSDFDVFVIMGQEEHGSLLAAQAEDITDLDFGTLPVLEIISAYKVTFRTNAGYGTEGQCRIEAVEDTRQSTASQVTSATPATSHPALSGLVWTNSGHIGTATRFAAFDATGAATEITDPVPIANGGSGQSTQQAAIDALTNVSAATNEHVLTKDTATGNAIFKAAGGAAATVYAHNPQGRLTLTSGNPIDSSDVTGASTLYYTPYLGNEITLYDTVATAWENLTFAETSLSLAGLTANTLYDIWGYNNSGTFALESTSWGTNTAYNISAATAADPCVITYLHTSQAYAVGDDVCIQGITGNINTVIHVTTTVTAIATVVAGVSYSITVELDTTGLTYTSGGTVRALDNTRATAITTQNNIPVKTGDASRRYLGTIMITGDGGETDDSEGRRFVANYYNKIDRRVNARYDVQSVTQSPASFLLVSVANACADGEGRVSFIAPYRGCSIDMVWGTATYRTAGTGAATIMLQQNEIANANAFASDSESAFAIQDTDWTAVFAKFYQNNENEGYNYVQKLWTTGGSTYVLWFGMGIVNDSINFDTSGYIRM